ncbi:hypothetical protein E2C01_102681 [Portunus trituberculatus]|uniref:Uncharacterized protein n=1 Tax=Portunus trituberculatus TaxID=210409 RepID=A0A5B7KHX5_PORTR|nr:hypothetical protein [Portunus trituberculatus]
MEKVAVLPVPDCACAMTSRPFTMGLMARCWMADGFSNPASPPARKPLPWVRKPNVHSDHGQDSNPCA